MTREKAYEIDHLLLKIEMYDQSTKLIREKERLATTSIDPNQREKRK